MKHHYIPQFLLAQWAHLNNDGKIEVFRLDLPGLKSNRRTPKHTGYEDDLYALSEENIAGMSKQAIEKQFLMRLDNSASLVRSKLATKGLRSLTDEDRVNWARFIMSLRIRRPPIIQSLKQDASTQLRASFAGQPEEYEELASDSDPGTLEEWAEKQFPGLIDNFGLSIFHEIVDNPVIGNKILGMRWWIWDFSGTPYELLISDNPCIFTAGIDDPGCIIALPISPSKVFIATQSKSVAEMLRQQQPRELIIRINESSFGQADVRIYSRQEKPARRFIENRLAQKKTGTSSADK